MMKFTTTGDNINVLVCTEYGPNNDWLSFSAWYSVHMYLPCSSVSISCSKIKANTHYLFHWAQKARVKCFRHKNTGFVESIGAAVRNGLVSTPLIAISDKCIALKEISVSCTEIMSEMRPMINNDHTVVFLPNNHDIISLKYTDAFNETFVDYNQLSKFSLSEWCEKKSTAPFGIFWKYYHENLTVNEAKILNLWQKMRYTYEIFKNY